MKKRFSKEKYLECLESLTLLHTDNGSSCIKRNPIIECKKEYDLQIIVPIYNAEKYLRDCIDSLVSQKTKYKYCIICINDGSFDSSSWILDSYSDYKNLYIINQENRGFSGARNRGLEFDYANYIMFVDSDDILDNSAVELLLDKAYEDNSDIVQGNYRSFISNKNKFMEYKSSKVTGFPWGKIYKSSLFFRKSENILVQFPLNYWFEDTVISFVVQYLASKISFINNFVYQYRINDLGITKNFKGKYKTIDTYYVTSRLLQDRKELNLAFDSKFENNLLSQFVMNMNRIRSLDKKLIDKSNFYCSKFLYELYYDYKNDIYKDNKYIRLALKKNSFILFYFASLLY